MKIQVTTLLLASLHVSAQNAKFPKIKLSTPCTTEFTNNYKGKWLITNDASSYDTETKKRIRQIHELVAQAYPEPTGGDAAWNGLFTKNSFANQVKYEWNQNQMFGDDR